MPRESSFTVRASGITILLVAAFARRLSSIDSTSTNMYQVGSFELVILVGWQAHEKYRPMSLSRDPIL